jgi:asparagine synthase (glutamine-hydrolysing)
VALGHRRLSIIDLTQLGRQPMFSEDGRLVLVFNGEIYNFIEIRHELIAKGHRFRSQSDSEVLLAAYEAWGADCVGRFNGMWALAIYDRVGKKLFLSRDRLGIKPLYYVHDDGRFAFTSEPKALLAAFPDLRRVSYAMLRHFLPSGLVDDGPETFFPGIVSLMPAHNLTLDLKTGASRCWAYWTIDPARFAEERVSRDPVADLEQLLESAVRLHMRADVPVGTCLSGGLDSSTLVSFMRDLHPERVHTFSGLYKGKDYDEEAFVVAVNDHLGCIGAAIRKQPDGDLLDDLATITWHQDMPTAGPGLYTQFNVMERASEDVKVILDGQGGDELFAGYLPYYALRINDLLKDGGGANVLSAYGLMGSVWCHYGAGWLNGVEGSYPAHLAKRLIEATQRAASRMRPAAASEPSFFHDNLMNIAERDQIRRRPASPYSDSLSNALFGHTFTQSIPALLHYEDRNSMAFSIEARVPLLDYRIVEFAMGLDPGFKIRDSWTKWVLRKVAAPRLPPSVTWRRSKMGYPTPAARWIRSGKDGAAMKELLFSAQFLDRGLVSRDSVEYYWRQHQEGRADRSWLLYRYATLELWFRHFIDRFEPCPARPAPTSVGRSTAMAAAL